MRKRVPAMILIVILTGACLTTRVPESEPEEAPPTPPPVEVATEPESDAATSVLGVAETAPGLEPKQRFAGPPPPRRSPNVDRDERWNTEAYDRIYDNTFRAARRHPLSTFSIDVDTASYANVRRFLQQGQLPPADAVRIEELINYFTYDYGAPTDRAPFSVDVEVGECPWEPRHRLARIGLAGIELREDERPASNLVFLLDVSGSMRDPRKLPLVKSAMRLLAERLTAEDRVSIVVYAGAAGLVLPATPGNDSERILAALESLEAGGSTAGGEGIRLAYRIAREQFIPGGVNRVVLATDGDFNVGATSTGELVRMIEDEARSGVFLSVLGFGMGNYKDAILEQLADKGNGNYAYIDDLREARKVLVEEVGSTLVTIAKDVKIQVEFNPARVVAYRLIGYENRVLQAEEFNDDTKDAGEIGAGHTVTALYELVPPGTDFELPAVDDLKYQRPSAPVDGAGEPELMTVKVRWKAPDADTSERLDVAVIDDGVGLGAASPDFKFASAVAGFGMILRDSDHHGDWTLDDVRALARESVGSDPNGHRTGFLEMVDLAARIAG